MWAQLPRDFNVFLSMFPSVFLSVYIHILYALLPFILLGLIYTGSRLKGKTQ